jgi:hypothetical protein
MPEQEEISHVEWEVLNPSAECEVPVVTLAPRLSDLNSKRIGLFWNGKPFGDILLEEIGALLKDRFENVEIIKFNLTISVGPDNIRRMSESSDAIVSAIHD